MSIATRCSDVGGGLGMATVQRFGKAVEVDEVFKAYTSGSIPKMLAALDMPTNDVDRHHLLQSLVRALYARRAGPKSRGAVLRVGAIHLDEMPSLIRSLRRHAQARSSTRRNDDALPHVETFLLMVRVLCEEGRYDEAAVVWQRAHAVGYLEDDGLANALAAIEKRRSRAVRKAVAALNPRSNPV